MHAQIVDLTSQCRAARLFDFEASPTPEQREIVATEMQRTANAYDGVAAENGSTYAAKKAEAFRACAAALMREPAP